MSFSSAAKEELMRIPCRHEGCVIAELSAVAQVGGSLLLGGGRMALSVQVENSALARRVYSMMKEAFGVELEIRVQDSRRLGKQHVYFVTLRERLPHILKTLNLMDRNGLSHRGLPAEATRSCCRRAFLRGIFLACGSVANPEKGYHLELVLKNPALADATRDLIDEFGLKVGLSRRKGDSVLYLKGADSIGDFLALIGAHAAILQHENARILKEMRNQVNRTVNCETANLNKTVKAAVRQGSCVRFLMEQGAFDGLNSGLREAGILRMQYPEASIQELADLTEPPTGKSGMNHRLRRLCQIAQELGWQDEPGEEMEKESR